MRATGRGLTDRQRHAPIDAGRLIQLVDAFEGRRIAVFGDLIVDEFIYGEIARVSREAPVLILNYDSTEIVPGGAGNAASNVAALGGIAGRHRRCRPRRAGDRLLDVLGKSANVAACGSAARLPDADQDAHPRRRHAFGQAAGGPHRSRRRRRSAEPHRDGIDPSCCAAVGRCDAMLVSDYGTGLVSPQLVSAAQKSLGAGPGPGRFALRTAALPRHDGLHAERVGSRAAVRRRASARTSACSSAPGASC